MMTEPTWDEVKVWMEGERARWMNVLRTRGVDIRKVDEANASLDMLDRMKSELAPEPAQGTPVAPVFIQ